MAVSEQQEPGIAGLSAAEVDAWVARSRAAQGLPPKITEPAVLARLVRLAFAGLGDQNTATPRGRRTPRRRIDRPAGQPEGHRDATRDP
jgi:hypothetical protein